MAAADCQVAHANRRVRRRTLWGGRARLQEAAYVAMNPAVEIAQTVNWVGIESEAFQLDFERYAKSCGGVPPARGSSCEPSGGRWVVGIAPKRSPQRAAFCAQSCCCAPGAWTRWRGGTAWCWNH